MYDYIAPSLLAADKSRLLDEIKLVEDLGAEYLHWDIMDGRFVPNKSFSLDIVRQYSQEHSMVNDVHIMVSDPEVEAIEFVEAGADIVTFHYEAVSSIEEIKTLIHNIHVAGAKAGLSIKPGTEPEAIFPLLKHLDLVLVMSVEPGLGGQKFMPNALPKIEKLRHEIDAKGYACLIEVDGGINAETGPLCRRAGADILVAGSYLFGHEDIAERIEAIR